MIDLWELFIMIKLSNHFPCMPQNGRLVCLRVAHDYETAQTIIDGKVTSARRTSSLLIYIHYKAN